MSFLKHSLRHPTAAKQHLSSVKSRLSYRHRDSHTLTLAKRLLPVLSLCRLYSNSLWHTFSTTSMNLRSLWRERKRFPDLKLFWLHDIIISDFVLEQIPYVWSQTVSSSVLAQQHTASVNITDFPNADLGLSSCLQLRWRQSVNDLPLTVYWPDDIHTTCTSVHCETTKPHSVL